MHAVGIGAALGQLGWWSGTVFMGEIGPILLSSQLRTSGTFYLFAGMCFLAFLHALLLIPETKVIKSMPGLQIYVPIKLGFGAAGTKFGKH